MIRKVIRNIKVLLSDFKVKVLFKGVRKLKKPALPENSDSKVLIHIGCGELNDKRYINIDTRVMPHVHFIGTVFDVDKFFRKDYADLIYLCHVLEHVSHKKLDKTLKKLYSRIKPGGILRISVPDFDAISKIYQKESSVESIVTPLMGGQGYQENYHCSVFNKDYLTKLLNEAGFEEVRQWDASRASYHAFDDWSKRKYIYNNKEWIISLNLEAVK
ncbi:MAG: methyltransferase domain-containing protein [Candidatus Omnitrophota bacterium]